MSDYTKFIIIKFVVLGFAALIYGFIRGGRKQPKDQSRSESED